MTHKQWARRDFLKLGLVTASASMITGCDVTDPVVAAAQQLRSPLTTEGGFSEILRYATLAASGHNTQPWKFAVKASTIEIHPDLSRALPVVDPAHRELWISLGCALENLVIAALASGYSSIVSYPDESRQFIDIELQPSTPQKSPLLDAIPLRQSTRGEYQPVVMLREYRDQIHAVPSESGVVLQFLEDKPSMDTALEYVVQGNLSQYSDAAFVTELVDWLRFNKKEALSTLDGLYSKCSGNPTVPRWIGKMVVSGTIPQNQADADVKKLRSSAGAVVLASEKDDPASWVRTGQVFERLSLTLTSLGLKSALLNQPIEVPDLRDKFTDEIGMAGMHTQLLLRYGVADAMSFSLRQPVKDLLL
jgi:hypothetical protein